MLRRIHQLKRLKPKSGTPGLVSRRKLSFAKPKEEWILAFPHWNRNIIFLIAQLKKHHHTTALCFKTSTYLSKNKYFAHKNKIELVENVAECT